MFEDLRSGRTTGEDTPRIGANRLLLVLAIGVGAAVTGLVAYVMLTKHPFGWNPAPPEFDRQSAHDRYQDFVRQVIWITVVEGVVGTAAQRLRASKQAQAAAKTVAGLVSTAAVILTLALSSPIPVVAGGVAALYVLAALKVADQWEKCVVFRFGRYDGLRGPGLFFIIPIVDRVRAVIDERVRTTDVHSEAALTRDTLRVNVDAVVFWQVWDAGKAALEVQDFDEAVGLVAQASLLESIGRHELAQVLAGREWLGRDLRQVLQAKTTPWGITVQSVEIRDIRLPRDLEDVMSRQAQAERERQARIILGSTEVELAARFAEASEAYKNDPTALHLRAMNILYEAIKEKGTMVVVPASALRRRACRMIR